MKVRQPPGGWSWLGDSIAKIAVDLMRNVLWQDEP